MEDKDIEKLIEFLKDATNISRLPEVRAGALQAIGIAILGYQVRRGFEDLSSTLKEIKAYLS